VGFARNRLGQHGLAGSGRADEQQALGQNAAQPAVFRGVAQKVHHFAHLGLGLVHSGDIAKTDGGPMTHPRVLPAADVRLTSRQSHRQTNQQDGRAQADPLAFEPHAGHSHFYFRLREQTFEIVLFEMRDGAEVLYLTAKARLAFDLVNPGVRRGREGSFDDEVLPDPGLELRARDFVGGSPQAITRGCRQNDYSERGSNNYAVTFCFFHPARSDGEQSRGRSSSERAGWGALPAKGTELESETAMA